MSWDATLLVSCPCGQGYVNCSAHETSWNYTHNTSPMIYRAGNLDTSPGAPSWYRHLDGLDGQAGAAFLGRILDGLRADPDAYRAMDPVNGWGNYDGIRGVLGEMHAASVAHPDAKWTASG